MGLLPGVPEQTHHTRVGVLGPEGDSSLHFLDPGPRAGAENVRTRDHGGPAQWEAQGASSAAAADRGSSAAGLPMTATSCTAGSIVEPGTRLPGRLPQGVPLQESELETLSA